jgi:hypothetical protein
VKSDVITINFKTYNSVLEAWEKEYSQNGWHLATIYFETLEMTERLFRQRASRATRGRGQHRSSGRRGQYDTPADIDRAWRALKRDPKARIALLSSF